MKQTDAAGMNIFDSAEAQIRSLLDGETNFIANASNFCSAIYHIFDNINWAGFYFLSGGELVLGPFQGKPACIRIPLGRGVCGAAAAGREALIVADVQDFPGHIACDPDSQSEIVIPIIKEGTLYGVLDIDSPVKNRFGNRELDAFTNYLEILIHNSDLEIIKKYY